VQKGHIKNLKIYGDFFGKESVSEVEERLQGIRYHPDNIAEAMNPDNVKNFSVICRKKSSCHLFM